ncbi:hypothetical protein LMG33818_000007 [Halomonadaceae bacterium LMG 33818]|uniref:hypothetical protein n=1 Tax=Cernens ardua TaxID=3402176 RepID=UPI003EDCA267
MSSELMIRNGIKWAMREAGVDLRDVFAGMALQFVWMDMHEEFSAKQIAESAYLVADAMMEARKK